MFICICNLTCLNNQELYDDVYVSYLRRYVVQYGHDSSIYLAAYTSFMVGLFVFIRFSRLVVSKNDALFGGFKYGYVYVANLKAWVPTIGNCSTEFIIYILYHFFMALNKFVYYTGVCA